MKILRVPSLVITCCLLLVVAKFRIGKNLQDNLALHQTVSQQKFMRHHLKSVLMVMGISFVCQDQISKKQHSSFDFVCFAPVYVSFYLDMILFSMICWVALWRLFTVFSTMVGFHWVLFSIYFFTFFFVCFIIFCFAGHQAMIWQL